MDQRQRDKNWNVYTSDNHYLHELHYQAATLATLLDIRDELRRIREVQNVLNTRLNCAETFSIPRSLARIAKNTTKRTRVRKVKP